MLMENHQNQKCYIYIYIHGILSPHEDGEEAIFQGQWGVCLSYGQSRAPSYEAYGGSQN